MDAIDIRKIDMTLLLVFQAVMRQRKLTAAAEQLSLTQSTISHAIGRLRDAFQDELFLRRSNGVEPTSRAIQLEPVVRDIIDMLRGALNSGEPFQPADARGIIRIAMPDHYCALMAAPLLRDIAQRAPGIQISIRPLVRRPAMEALAANDIDLALGFFWKLQKGLTGKILFEDGHRAIVRKGHPTITKALSLKAFLAADHILVSLGGDLEGVVDKALSRIGKQRRVVSGFPFFLPALSTVSRTDLIATVPRRPALAFAGTFGLNVFKCPVEIPTYQASAIWHRRNENNELLKWVLARIELALATAECGGLNE